MTSHAESSVSVSSALKDLSRSAVALNSAATQLAKTIEVLDAALKKLNLGISSWVEVAFDSSLDERFWRSERLGYAKIAGKWGLALRVVSGDELAPPEASETVNEWSFAEASRELRIKAIEHLPRLIAKLNEDAQAVTKKLHSGIDEAEKLAAAISSISETSYGFIDLVELKRHVVAVLRKSRGHSSAADQLEEANWFTDDEGVLKIQTGLSAGMLRLLLNDQAQQIVNDALLEKGSYRTVHYLASVGKAGNQGGEMNPIQLLHL